MDRSEYRDQWTGKNKGINGPIRNIDSHESLGIYGSIDQSEIYAISIWALTRTGPWIPIFRSGLWMPIFLIGPWIPIFLTDSWIPIFWPVRGILYFWMVHGSLYSDRSEDLWAVRGSLYFLPVRRSLYSDRSVHPYTLTAPSIPIFLTFRGSLYF